MDRDRGSGLLRPIVSSFFFFSFSLFMGGILLFFGLVNKGRDRGKGREKRKRKKDRLRALVCVYLRCGGWDEMR